MNFFKLPAENARKFFPYNLKYLAILSAWGFREEALEELGRRYLSFLNIDLYLTSIIKCLEL